jgi:hypothetical protein
MDDLRPQAHNGEQLLYVTGVIVVSGGSVAGDGSADRTIPNSRRLSDVSHEEGASDSPRLEVLQYELSENALQLLSNLNLSRFQIHVVPLSPVASPSRSPQASATEKIGL